MDPSFILVQFLTGLASASLLFVIASGLTVVFGVTRIVNFAHGSLYMLGAYLAVTLLPRLLETSPSFAMFVLGIALSALLVGAIGVAMEVLVLRRIYPAPELFQLLATFGIVLILQDATQKIWGPTEILGPRAPGFTGASASVLILGQRFPTYELLLIVIGPLVLGALWLVMHRTRFGVLVRAATQDREMVGALGVNQSLLFTGAVFLGAALAGLGGALQTPKTAANLGMDLAILTEAFVVTVVGGMGSISGAFLAALIIGQLQAFGILIFPKVTLVLVFLLMAAVLIVKPWGLMGRPEATHGRVVLPEGFMGVRPLGTVGRAAVAAGLVLVALLPLAGDNYALKVGVEVLVFALAAFSLAFLISNGGLVSFGHAAYFGLGAYAAGLLVKRLGVPMELALVAAPLVAGLGALVFGHFIVRLSGIYLAMLTLAFAQISYAVAFQWIELTGGDNGVVGVWPSPWAASRVVYYYIVAILTVVAIAALWHLIHAPFGYTLRAARDSQPRADAIGIDVRTHRWLAFAIAGAAAGLGGGLYAFAKGSIDPTLLAIPTSVDFLVMGLVGGIQTLGGAIVGAGVFHAIKDQLMPLTDYWRFLLGLAIVAIVLLFPQGVAGAAEAAAARLAARRRSDLAAKPEARS
jgi:branched-chain amino acid transport system permease protein